VETIDEQCAGAANVSWKELKTVAVVDSEAHKAYPVDGSIRFENVKMRYRPSAGLALAGVNLTIGHSEKVGIVGRTGSGKSTLLMALYRMFDLMVRIALPAALLFALSDPVEAGHGALSCAGAVVVHRAKNSRSPC
jgi:ABC-type multidrug transport system fused ATPase/permease subunit